MSAATIIRDERPGDEMAITAITIEAFRTHPHSHQTEHLIVDALREAGALTLSLVAENAGVIVGHIAFSPITIGDDAQGWYGLGPVSVQPEQQGRGIGQALVQAGLARLRMLGARGCVLVGEPGFYSRFGFGNNPSLDYPGVPQTYLLALSFDNSPACGKVRFHHAFEAS